MSARAQRVIDWCRTLAELSEEPGRTTRTFLSPPMHDVHRLLGDWMRGFGMQVSIDAAGNLRGLLAGASLQSQRVVIGSHLDTVPNAGAFDGILGVVLGVALAEIAAVAQRDNAIEVIGFSEEEGVRFGVPFIGSRAVAGTLDDATVRLAADAIRQFGLDPEKLPEARYVPESTAYLEFHIEQGPVLESMALPLGLVDSIAGQSRLEFTFDGQSNHAGTTPMALRRDALTGAAEWILRVEEFGRSHAGMVATVGRVQVEPNATNVIAGYARVSLDVRHASDDTRRSVVTALVECAQSIAMRRGLAVAWEQRLDQGAVAMNAEQVRRVARAMDAAGYPAHHMTSGAGHDAMVIAPHIPSAMLFLRSPGGISHSPDESVLVEDVEAAIAVGERFLCLI